MAAHRRAEFRALLVDRLRSAVTLAGDQVYSGRMTSAGEGELANGGVIFIYTGKEKAESYPASGWNGELRRLLEVRIEGLVPAFRDITPDSADFNQDVLESIDELAGQIEDALETWEPPGFESGTFRLRETDSDVSDENGMPVGRALMVYELDYGTVYRGCSDPLVDNENEDLRLRGLYPGGQVVEGCPATQVGEVCPISDADVVTVFEGGPV